jgi:alcohol dehydrogenase YqhD (iron-dependent ADH family)
MDNFEIYLPTKVIFGKECLDNLGPEIKPFGKKVLIVIGQRSAKQNGLYARVISLLNILRIEHCTFEGVKTNADCRNADEAIALARQNQVELVLAIGGCSVIDTAKAVSIGYYTIHVHPTKHCRCLLY